MANDYDPNNNINVASLVVLKQPINGAALISNGKIVYLPNGSFTGKDTFTYKICDRTSPTPLCATATVYVTISATFYDPCAEATSTHTFYMPFPEQDAWTALTASASNPTPSNNIRTIISISIPYPGMKIVWDHWEDGYETDPLNPTQSTTQVWGDGNPYNGIAPGYPNDILPAGARIVLDNTMPVNPRVATNFFYDGKDKMVSTGQATVTQVCGEPSIIGLQCMKSNVSAVTNFGTFFTVPVGSNYGSQDFKYTALFVTASADSTIVNIDKDNNGTFETTATLNQGQSLFVNGGIFGGAMVTATQPIGVQLHFGGVDAYSSRDVTVYPAYWYGSTYYSPEPTTLASDSNAVYLYNSLSILYY